MTPEDHGQATEPSWPKPSWEDPDHPLYQEYEEQIAAVEREHARLNPPPDPPPVPMALAIADALRAIAQPGAVGYAVQDRVYRLMEKAGLGGPCHGGYVHDRTLKCVKGTEACSMSHPELDHEWLEKRR